MIEVCLGQYRVIPRARSQQRCVSVGYIRQFSDTQGVFDWRADEV